MKADASALRDRRFWAAYLSSSFGQIGEAFDCAEACSAFGVSERAARSWWEKFTGGHDGPSRYR